MECVQPCGEAQTSCPQGSVCFASVCRRTCDATQENICSPEERCILYPERELSLCFPKRE